MKALIRRESDRYGAIVSRHKTAAAAGAAMDRMARRVMRAHPDAIVHVMYAVVDLPTPAGGNGRAGDRVAIDLSR